MVKATTSLLASAGWSVSSFTSTTAFLAEAAIHHPHVALVDVLMPGMNGLEVQTRLRELSPTTRVIFLSGDDDPETRRRALQQGAFAYLLKGTTPRKLLAGIKAARGNR